MDEGSQDRFSAFQKGDEHAFRVYYEKYYHALCLWVLRMIKDETFMHDMVQEAFISLWKAKETIESELHLKMFLYQAVRHRCLNYLKNKKIEDRCKKEYLALQEEAYFEQVVLEEEVYRLVIQEIQALPEEQRRVIELHLEGKNNMEIADLLQVSVNTVKTHKARARKALKNKLDNILIVTILLGL